MLRANETSVLKVRAQARVSLKFSSAAVRIVSMRIKSSNEREAGCTLRHRQSDYSLRLARINP